MAQFPSKGTSLWLETTPYSEYPALADDTQVDVAIIGGGMAGLSAAHLLKQAGKRVAVFEKARIGSGVTGYTTGKVTSQHGLIYSNLIKRFGKEAAHDYGQANQAAIQQIEMNVELERIDCDWQRADNYIFTESKKKVEALRREAKEAAGLGLPAAFTTKTSLPFKVQAAVRFENQATLHVGKYLQGLAAAIEGGGSKVYEQSKAMLVHENNDGATLRANGYIVDADQVIIATNVPSPLVMHAVHALLEYPTRSYIISGKPGKDIDGMYINVGSPSRSILPITLGGERHLLLGGEGHMVGVSGPAKGHYDKLVEYAQRHFDMEIVEHKWSTWDYLTYDEGPPLIGPAYPWSKRVFVATGFRKWGLTNAVVAGMILTDMIIGRHNPWAHSFRSNRLSAMAAIPKGLVKGLFR
jgi:glycine/D-amino acid oxidase-like deaminating enzyme